MQKRKIGFTAGAFDMFHVGHLNLLENAKKLCDYLIVGVNSDELITVYKNKKAVVPLEERMRIVNAIRYVDEVISVNTLDKVEILKDKNFDVVFIGSDWKGTERWNRTEEALAKYNVEVIYLPYTTGTTSSLLREKLKEY
ncbi:MAG: adenylyltransferase/cytidyltransferase family protein [Clostridiaceae bacterium]|nr:adenylyltransferase/cytidyltransferase family protein [Clostridiaceae bacterium]